MPVSWELLDAQSQLKWRVQANTYDDALLLALELFSLSPVDIRNNVLVYRKDTFQRGADVGIALSQDGIHAWTFVKRSQFTSNTIEFPERIQVLPIAANDATIKQYEKLLPGCELWLTRNPAVTQ